MLATVCSLLIDYVNKAENIFVITSNFRYHVMQIPAWLWIHKPMFSIDRLYEVCEWDPLNYKTAHGYELQVACPTNVTTQNKLRSEMLTNYVVRKPSQGADLLLASILEVNDTGFSCFLVTGTIIIFTEVSETYFWYMNHLCLNLYLFIYFYQIIPRNFWQ